MTNRTTYATICVMLLFATTFLPIAAVSGDSRATAHASITISGDAAFITANGVTGGTGTSTDPYIISGWEFSSTALANGISVASTTKYFKITNCVFGGTNTIGIGIALQNVGNATIESNTFTSLATGLALQTITDSQISLNTFTSDATAVALQNSGNVKFFKNTITTGAHGLSVQGTTGSKFYENTFTTMAQAIAMNGQVSGNEFYKNSIKGGTDGMSINEASNNKFYENLLQDITGNAITVGSGSTGNKFYKNDFIHNNPTGKQATSSSSADTWYDTTNNKGNYWSDWTSPDANTDGVVDLPYALAGAAATDNYPVTAPVAGGIVAPALAVAFTSDKTTGTAPVLITYTVTPSGGTAPYTTNITYGDGKFGTDLGHTYYQGGTFVASVTVKDNKGATKTSGTISLTITAPLNVSVTATTTTGKAPLAVGFTSTCKGGVGPYNYTWDFGDGTAKSYEANPTHVFKNTGSYTVKLTVKDSKGTTESATKNVFALKVQKPAGFIPGFEAMVLIVVVLAALVIVGRRKN